MSVKDKIKALFAVAEKFATIQLEDGTEVTYEGEIAKDTVLMVMVDGEPKPLAAGTHNLGGDMAGKAVTVDEKGMILEVVEVEAAAEENEAVEALAQITAEKMKAQSDSFKKLEAKYTAQEKEIKEIKEKFNKLVEDFAAGKLDMEKFKSIKPGQPKTDYTSKLF